MKLSEWLNAEKVSQSAVADRLGFSRSLVCRWISGERKPNLYAIDRIENMSDGKVQLKDWISDKRA